MSELILIVDKKIDRYFYTRVLEESLLDALQKYEDVIGDPLFQPRKDAYMDVLL